MASGCLAKWESKFDADSRAAAEAGSDERKLMDRVSLEPTSRAAVAEMIWLPKRW
jgi:hypothetical protein